MSRSAKKSSHREGKTSQQLADLQVTQKKSDRALQQRLKKIEKKQRRMRTLQKRSVNLLERIEKLISKREPEKSPPSVDIPLSILKLQSHFPSAVTKSSHAKKTLSSSPASSCASDADSTDPDKELLRKLKKEPEPEAPRLSATPILPPPTTPSSILPPRKIRRVTSAAAPPASAPPILPPPGTRLLPKSPARASPVPARKRGRPPKNAAATGSPAHAPAQVPADMRKVRAIARQYRQETRAALAQLGAQLGVPRAQLATRVGDAPRRFVARLEDHGLPPLAAAVRGLGEGSWGALLDVVAKRGA